MKSSWLLCLCLAGCGTGKVYGTDADPDGLKAEAEAFRGDLGNGVATVRGEVGEVCPMGCWFYLLGPSDMIYVELDLATGFVIPKNSQGKQVVVKGTLKGTATERRLKADTVLLF